MNSVVWLIFNESFVKKKVCGSVNSAWDPLKKHSTAEMHISKLKKKKKKKEGRQNIDAGL